MNKVQSKHSSHQNTNVIDKTWLFENIHAKIILINLVLKSAICPTDLLHATNIAGSTILIVACEMDKYDLVKVLLNCKHCTKQTLLLQDVDGNTAFHIACKKQNFKIIKLFMQSFKCISKMFCVQNKKGYTPLHLMIKYSDKNDISLCKYVLSSKKLLRI